MPRRDRRRLVLIAALAVGPLLAVGLVAARRAHDPHADTSPSTRERFEAAGYRIVFNLWEREAITDTSEGLTVNTPADADGVRYTVYAHRTPADGRITLRGRISSAGEDIPPMFEAVYSADGEPPRVADGCGAAELVGTRAACDRVAAIIFDKKPTT